MNKKRDKLDENGEPLDLLEDMDIDSEEEFKDKDEELDYDALDSDDITAN